MNWDAIGAVGELVGALAVLVTLIYLAIQVRHTRRAQEAEAIRANRVERREFHTAIRDSPYIPMIYAKIDSGEKLTAEEEHRLAHDNVAVWGMLYSQWIQTQLDWQGNFQTSQSLEISHIITQPRHVEFFERFGRQIYPKEFTDYVESLMHKNNEQSGV